MKLMFGDYAWRMVNVNGHSQAKHAPLASELGCIVGLNIERLRKQARINKSMFSLMLGIGRPTLNRLEKGIGNPRLELIERIATALDIEPYELLKAPFEDVDASFYVKSRSLGSLEDSAETGAPELGEPAEWW